MKTTGIARNVVAVLLLVGAFHATAQFMSAAGRMEEGRIKDIFKLAQRSAEDDYNIDFCGFFVGMSWHDCAALCEYYRLAKEDCTFWREDEKAVWQIQISLKGICRITKGGNTFSELARAVASRVGDMEIKNILAGEREYECKTIGGVVVTMSESNGLVIRNENLKSREPVGTPAARQKRARAEKMKWARQSIEKTVKTAKEEYEEFHKLVLQGDKVVEEAVRDVKKVLPEELQALAAGVLAPQPLPDIAQAIAYTNKLFAAQAPAPAAEEKPAENAVSPIALPQSVKNFEKVWADVCQYRAADIMLHGEVQKLLKRAEAADEIIENAKKADTPTAQEEAATALARLANELVEAYSRLKSEKWLIDAKRKVLGIDARARNYSGDVVKKIKLAIERHERALKEKREAEEKAAAAAAAVEKQKEKVEEERQKAQEEFDALAADIKRIDWGRCTRQLTRLQERMVTREGKEAVKDQLHKIEAMEGMQKHFINHAKGFCFKDRRGQLLAVVTKVDDRSLTIHKVKYVKGKPVPDKETRVEWARFYGLKEKGYLGYMNQFINELVIKGQDREKTRVGPREWSDNMLGAALTLQHLYSEEKGVDKFIPVLVKKAVKGFEPCRKWAGKWFPDVELPEAEDTAE